MFFIRTRDGSFTFYRGDCRHVWGKSTAECRSPGKESCLANVCLAKVKPICKLDPPVPWVGMYWAGSRDCGNGCVLQRGWGCHMEVCRHQGWTWTRRLQSERLWLCVCWTGTSETSGEIITAFSQDMAASKGSQNRSTHCGVVFMLLKSKLPH